MAHISFTATNKYTLYSINACEKINNNIINMIRWGEWAMLILQRNQVSYINTGNGYISYIFQFFKL